MNEDRQVKSHFDDEHKSMLKTQREKGLDHGNDRGLEHHNPHVLICLCTRYRFHHGVQTLHVDAF